MAIQASWKILYEVRDNLEKVKSLTPNSQITFILLFKDERYQKKTIKFKDFLKFFWFIYDSNKFYVRGLVIVDQNDNILYRHQHSQKENLPIDGNIHVFDRWKSMTQEQKEAHIDILAAQINDYGLQQRFTRRPNNR